MPLAANPLIEVSTGLMIWTLLCFGITFFVLRRYAFGPVQKLIDERRQRIREAIEEADKARADARRLLEEHKQLMAQARGQAEQILTETTKQIASETARALEQIRGEVAELTVVATEKVTGKVLDESDQRRLIDEAIGELDFSVLEGGRR
jgi:F-type H+-transporting ATPase subunit b